MSVLYVVPCLLLLLGVLEATHPNHGGVPMGIPNDRCDNGQWKIDVDWDPSSDFEYTCQQDEAVSATDSEPIETCIPKEDLPHPLHKCMTEEIVYEDKPPTAGPHRPLWPVYGEYTYVPPQRWVHSLEHGAAVFLYHPCSDPYAVADLKNIAKECLRKHVITPYRDLPADKPFAILTYGCKLLMSHVDEDRAKTFVQKTAMKAPEYANTRDGQYSEALLVPAAIVSDLKDSDVCPGFASSDVEDSDGEIDAAGSR